ncbi:MAG TPA: SUMF1/EgtB/PvdO family nonheme iron enzyme [Burkholderiales bacterium]|nr:SUMF1/EgtB/PvdO family nonheme iron enzyme [Burkholderiales bacterium]
MEPQVSWLKGVVTIVTIVTIVTSSCVLAQEEDERSPDAPDLPQEVEVPGWIREGNALMEEGRADEAAERFAAQAKAEPGNATAQHLLGVALWQLGRKDKAREAFQRALKLDPNGPHAIDARTYLADKAPVEAARPDLQAYPKAGKVIQDCPKCPVVVVVPAGRFAMPYVPGDSGRYHHEGPVRPVTFDRPFAMGKYEVTFDEWEACVAEQACPKVDDKGRGKGRRPVVYVSWDNAVDYAKWLSKKTGKTYRLPNEAEWEYAYRSGTDERHRFLNIPPAKVCAVANVYDKRGRQQIEMEYEPLPCDDKFGEVAPVGSFKPNAFGLHDMIGNVSEWVEDCLPTGLQWRGAPVDGTANLKGDCTQRGFRGGSFLENEKYYLRNSDRFRFVGAKESDLGFRVVRVLP